MFKFCLFTLHMQMRHGPQLSLKPDWFDYFGLVISLALSAWQQGSGPLIHVWVSNTLLSWAIADDLRSLANHSEKHNYQRFSLDGLIDALLNLSTNLDIDVEPEAIHGFEEVSSESSLTLFASSISILRKCNNVIFQQLLDPDHNLSIYLQGILPPQHLQTWRF